MRSSICLIPSNNKETNKLCLDNAHDTFFGQLIMIKLFCRYTVFVNKALHMDIDFLFGD